MRVKEMAKSNIHILHKSYNCIENSAYGLSVSRSIPTEILVGTSLAKAADVTQEVSFRRAESPRTLRLMRARLSFVDNHYRFCAHSTDLKQLIGDFAPR